MNNLHRYAGRALALVLLLAFCGTALSQTPPAPLKHSRYTLELVPFAEHTGENAVDLTHARDGTGRVFVSTQSGQVFAFDRDGGQLGTFLDIAQARPDFTRTDGSFNGLMYIAFHPDYARQGAPGEGLFYTSHQVALSEAPADYDSKDYGALGDSDVRFVIAEWHVDPDNPDRIDPGSYRQVMLINFHTTGSNPHAVGELAFNPFANPGDPDYGNLYFSVGDSNNRNESGETNLAYTQRTDNPFAKILRINPLGDADNPYTIPADNPFTATGPAEEADTTTPRVEAYAIGLRNSQSFTFAKDLEGNVVIVGFDMGAATAEEVNIIRAGGNYGWDRLEGTTHYDRNRQLLTPASRPVAQYGHAFPTRPGDDPSGGPAAVVGGFVCDDPDQPLVTGQIIFADLPRGTLMHTSLHEALEQEEAGNQADIYVMQASAEGVTGTFAECIDAPRADIRFGVDQDNRVFVVSKQTQTIYRTDLVYTGEPVKTSTAGLARSPMLDINWLPWAAGGGFVLFVAVILLFLIFQARSRRAPGGAKG